MSAVDVGGMRTAMNINPDGSFALIAGSSTTQSLPLAPVAPTTHSVFTSTFNGSTYTANSNFEFVIAGQTLTIGDAVTVFGTPISYVPSGGGDVVVASSSTEAVGFGGLIMGGFGGSGGVSTGETGMVQFTAGAGGWRVDLVW